MLGLRFVFVVSVVLALSANGVLGQDTGATPLAAAAELPVTPTVVQAEDDAPALELHGRVMTGYSVDREHPAGGQPPREPTDHGFFLRQARIELDARLDQRVSAAFSYDIESNAMRNAYLNVRVMKKALQLRAGHFKRPFTRLANRSVGSIPFRARGLFDATLLEDQQWGDRALGAMAFGRPVKALRYYAAVMSPAAFGSDIEGADVIGRLEWEPVEALSIGVAGAHKWTERSTDGPNLSLHGAAVDAKVELGALYVAAEVDAAQNPNPAPVSGSTGAREPWAIGAQAYGTYAFEVGGHATLGPVLVVEWMDPDTDYSRDQRVRGVLGLVWSYRDGMLRVMPQVELTRPLESASPQGEVASESYYLLVAAEF